MAEIKQVYREKIPALRLIGKKYHDPDRGPLGGFGMKWVEWYEKAYYSTLEQLGPIPESEGAHIGCMRMIEGSLEYWTGMFFPEGTPVPDGYTYADIPAGEIGTCWVYGHARSGELYGEYVHFQCVRELEAAGWEIADDYWYFERYVCPRFSEPDEYGKVIMDYCIYLK